MPSALTVLSAIANSDEETSDTLDWQDAGRPLSIDGEAVPGGEQAPTQGRPPRRSDPDLSAVREGDLSDRLHQQDDRGLVCPLCKVHGELVGGLSLAKEAVDGEMVYSKVCQLELVPN